VGLPRGLFTKSEIEIVSPRYVASRSGEERTFHTVPKEEKLEDKKESELDINEKITKKMEKIEEEKKEEKKNDKSNKYQ